MKRAHTNIDLVMEENGIKNDKQLGNKLGWDQKKTSYRLRGNITMKTLEEIAECFSLTVKSLIR